MPTKPIPIQSQSQAQPATKSLAALSGSTLIVVTRDELREFFEALRAEHAAEAPAPEWGEPSDGCARYKVSRPTLNKWIAEGMPVSKIGTSDQVRLHFPTTDTWLKARRP